MSGRRQQADRLEEPHEVIRAAATSPATGRRSGVIATSDRPNAPPLSELAVAASFFDVTIGAPARKELRGRRRRRTVAGGLLR